jgi:hypothetical protein
MGLGAHRLKSPQTRRLSNPAARTGDQSHRAVKSLRHRILLLCRSRSGVTRLRATSGCPAHRTSSPPNSSRRTPPNRSAEPRAVTSGSVPVGTVNNHRFDLPCAGEPLIVLDIENHYAAGNPCLPQRRIGRIRVLKSFREQQDSVT